MKFPNYEGYEDLTTFTPGGLTAYREMLLEKTQPQVDFIGEHVWVKKRRSLSVMEIGSGNGRLLIGLHQQGLLNYGVGLDLSESRTRFAIDWSNELGITDIDWYGTVNVAMKTYPFLPQNLDLTVCITGCFQYLYPASSEAPSNVLNFMRNTGEYALFELYRKPQTGRTWRRLPDDDPWEYLLDEYKDVGDWVTHTKTFIGRDGKQDVRVENLAYYKMDVFLGHLKRAGFNNVHWAKQNSTSMVILVS